MEKNIKEDYPVRVKGDIYMILCFYCKWKNIRIKDFVSRRLEQDPDLIKFRNSMEKLKFL